jgi:hypothetical protein
MSTFNTRSTLSHMAEVATLAVMVGMSLVPAAMAYNSASVEAQEMTRLPTVIVTAKGAQEATQFETVYVIGKRAS